MKKFNLFKMLAVLVVLITSLTTQVWAWDCGWLVPSSGAITFSINGVEKSIGTVDRGGSGYNDLELGTVTSSLKIVSAWANSWGENNVHAIYIYYRVKERDKASSESYSDYQIQFEKNLGGNNQSWYTKSDVYPNIDGLDPGDYEIEYYFKLYPKTGHSCEYEDMNNNNANFHANFTIPSKNLTVAGAANGNTVSGNQTGISKGTAYTITATPAPGYKFNGWTATTGSSSISITDASSATTTVTFNDFSNNVTVTASFVRTYAFIEGRFQIKNAARNSTTTTYEKDGQWASGSTKIIMSYDGGNKRHELHTYMTPSELSANHGTGCIDCKPYFYIKTSTDDESLTDVTQYWASIENTTISGTGTGSGATLTHTGDFDDNNLRISSSDVSGYAVLYFDESKVWYELEQTLTYNGNGNTGGSAPTTTYVERTKSVTAASKPEGLAKTGYTFAGWNDANDGSGTNYTAGSSSITMGSTDKTVYAEWTQTVTLHDNNGGSHNGSTTATWNAAGPFSTTAPTKTGYSVEGYYAEAGMTNKVLTNAGAIAASSVVDGSSVTFISGSKWAHAAATTLYAKWTAKTTSVTLNPNTDNHGTGESLVVTATYDQSTLASFVAATPASGYTLDGYYTGATNGNKIVNADGTLVRNTAYTSDEATPVWKSEASSLTLYAHYTANPYTLTLDDQFGSTAFYVAANSGDATIDVTFDASTNLTSTISAPQREGYIFGGYYTSTGGSGTQIIDENGDVKASASDVSYTYTDASRNWKYVGNLTVYAKWTDDNVYVFIGDDRPEQYGGGFYDHGFWRSDDNWAKGKAPSDIDNHEVILIKQPSVENVSGETYTACAKNVKIITNGSYTCVDGTEIPIAEYPKLDIDDNGAIVVKEYVKTYDLVGKTFGPTTSLNLHINAGTERWGAAGAGGVLIVGNKITDNKAWVEFYTKARKSSHVDGTTGETVYDYINQYFGIPFDSTSVHDYEGVYLYAYKAETNSYEAAGNKPVDPFKAYLMLRTQADGTTLHMTGRLALPGTNLENTDRLKVLNLHSKAVATASNMFANSWNGPLDIKAMDAEDDFVGVEPTFYLYNAGSKYDRDQAAGSWIGNGAGQWTSLPVTSLQADPKSYPQTVIPPQQAFLLVAQSDEEAGGTTHTLTLDYYKHVYKPAYDSVKAGKKIEIAPTRAPKREKTDESLQIIRLIVVGQETSFNDRVIMYQRGDFSDGLDQGWEGRKIMGSAFAPQMFAISEDGKMSINAVKDIEGTVIGFRKGSEDAQYTISFEYEGDETWYLNDLKEEKSTLINDEETYAFTSDAGDIEARFVISATPIQKKPTSVDEVTEGIKVRKLMIDGTFYIIRDGRIYDIVGKSVK